MSYFFFFFEHIVLFPLQSQACLALCRGHYGALFWSSPAWFLALNSLQCHLGMAFEHIPAGACFASISANVLAFYLSPPTGISAAWSRNLACLLLCLFACCSSWYICKLSEKQPHEWVSMWREPQNEQRVRRDPERAWELMPNKSGRGKDRWDLDQDGCVFLGFGLRESKLLNWKCGESPRGNDAMTAWEELRCQVRFFIAAIGLLFINNNGLFCNLKEFCILIRKKGGKGGKREGNIQLYK